MSLPNTNDVLKHVDPETIKGSDALKYKSFDDMEFLNFDLLRGIFEYGFKDPSRIQNLTIDKIYSGRDLIAQSQSGTGKTGAFCIGALTRIDVELKRPQVLILANTRELASQIHTVITELSKHMKIHIELCTGGTVLGDDRAYKTFNKSVLNSHILVGTPGKMDDLIQRGVFRTKTVKLLILDEADALLKNDFVEQIRTIFVKLTKETQICIYSATYQQTILDLATEIMKEPELVLLKQEDLSLDLIKQYKIYIGSDRYKYDTLKDLYKQMYIGQCIIFVNSKENADRLVDLLTDDGHSVSKIHGSLDTKTRCDILKDFRIGRTRVLVSTDVLSRGIDIQQIGIVINYDVPRDRAQYIHRIGRSGRFGKIGVAINFVTFRDKRTIEDLEDHYKIIIGDMPEFDVINRQLSGLNGHLDIGTSS
jgi:superfamily II DNA/RNA helicase